MSEYLNDNKYTYDYFYQGNVCRLCWKDTDNAKLIEDDSVLAQIIEELVGVKIKGHILQMVCCSCADKLESFRDFKKFCLEADQKLKRILDIGPLGTNIKFEHHDPSILKREADLELKVLKIECKKEAEVDFTRKNCYNLFIDDSHFTDLDEEDFFPVEDDYCHMCKKKFETIDEKLNHDVLIHKMLLKSSYKCYFCNETFRKFSDKLCHEVKCNVKCKVTKKKAEITCHSPKIRREKKHNPIISRNKYKELKKNKGIKIPEPIKSSKTLKCEECKITFDNNKEFRKHKDKHYFNTECVCEVCGKVCRRSAMPDHMRIHYNFKELKCPHCDYRATVRRSMDLHVRRKHTVERPFACEVCPYRSATSSNLAAHRRTHTGDKNYVCQLCSKSYSYKASLKNHIINAHEGKKRFRCDVCAVQYYNFDGLRKHLLVKHGKRVRKVRDDFVEIDPEEDKKTSADDKNCEEGMQGAFM